jgi:hypothetical protein
MLAESTNPRVEAYKFFQFVTWLEGRQFVVTDAEQVLGM